MGKPQSFITLDPHTPEYWDARSKQSASDAEMVGWANMPFDKQESYAQAILASLICVGHRVLDVGCGYGRFSTTCIQCGAYWTGLDFSTGLAVKHLERFQAHPQSVFRLADAHRPLPDLGKFRLIFCIGGYKTCGFNTPDEFVATYEPFIERPGHIVLIENAETIVRNFW